jgi:hypothetical protein
MNATSVIAAIRHKHLIAREGVARSYAVLCHCRCRVAASGPVALIRVFRRYEQHDVIEEIQPIIAPGHAN